MSLAPGDLLDEKYRISRLIGQGGMGAVYEGENIAIARRVAIKVLHGGLANDEAVVERFEREAQAAGRIGNDHILEVLDLGRLPNNDRFMVMEYLDGETLDQRCERVGRLSEQEVYPIACQLLTGLAAAHAAGIVHRDLKPDNVFIVGHKAGHTDFVKIIDFGISKFTGGSNFRMTMTGAIMGTPYYMSPEQAKGSKDADFRSDLYAVGVVMFRALSGVVPFEGDTFNELIFKVALAETPRVSQHTTIDPSLDDIVYRAMARSPSDRYQTALEFRDALDAWALSRGWSVSNGRLSQSQLSLVELRDTDVAPAPGTSVGGPSPSSTHVQWTYTGATPLRAFRWKWIAPIALVLLGGTLIAAFSRQQERAAVGEDPAISAGSASSRPEFAAQPTQESGPAGRPAPALAPPMTTNKPQEQAPGVSTASSGKGTANVSRPSDAVAQGSTMSDSSAPAMPSVRRKPSRSPAKAKVKARTPQSMPKPKPKPRPSDILGY